MFTAITALCPWPWGIYEKWQGSGITDSQTKCIMSRQEQTTRVCVVSAVSWRDNVQTVNEHWAVLVSRLRGEEGAGQTRASSHTHTRGQRLAQIITRYGNTHPVRHFTTLAFLFGSSHPGRPNPTLLGSGSSDKLVVDQLYRSAHF